MKSIFLSSTKNSLLGRKRINYIYCKYNQTREQRLLAFRILQNIAKKMFKNWIEIRQFLIQIILFCYSSNCWTIGMSLSVNNYNQRDKNFDPNSMNFIPFSDLKPRQSNKTITDLVSILRRNAYYNKDDIPTIEQGVPTIVSIQMYIEGMSSFRAQTMDFDLDIYFQEEWIDERLKHNSTQRILVKDLNLFNLIWHPDLYFANARTAEFHYVTSPNFLLWIYPNGTVWYDCRVALKVICMLNLARYPLDSQSCTLRILSYAHDTEQLVIKWKKQVNGNEPIQRNPEILMPDMRLRKIMPELRNDSYTTGIWSCAIVEFVVDRELTHHIIQSYLPSSLIVVISWFSFWLDVESVPGRVSLSITTLLTLATQNSAERMTLPQSSYLKASDVFGGVCLAFVFSAMIEFTIVNYCTRRKHFREDRRSRHLKNHWTRRSITGRNDVPIKNNKNNAIVENTMLLERINTSILNNHKFISPTVNSILLLNRKSRIEERIQRVEQNRKQAQAIDRKCRIYFPLAFLIFNIVYWIYYLIIATDQL